MNVNQILANCETFKTILTISCENREAMRCMRAKLEEQVRELPDVYVTTSDVYHSIFDSRQLLPGTIDSIRTYGDLIWQMAHSYSVYVIAPEGMQLSQLNIAIDVQKEV